MPEPPEGRSATQDTPKAKLGTIVRTLVIAAVVFVSSIGGTYVAQTVFTRGGVSPSEETPAAGSHDLLGRYAFNVERGDSETLTRSQESLPPLAARRGAGEPFIPRPWRHVGPLMAGSEFSEVQVVLTHPSNGQWRATWYHNGYYVGHPDSALLSLYYAPGTLPQDATPVVHEAPGSRDAPVLFALDSLRYSSRFGGSIQLHFLMSEDIGFEFVSGQDLWDVRVLEMSIFINPEPSVFNPVTPGGRNLLGILAGRPRNVEFVADDVTSYVAVSTDDLVQLPEETAVPLEPLLSEAVSAIEGSPLLVDDAFRFVHAYLHQLFQDRFGPTDGGDYVEVSDNYFMLYTRERQPILWIEIRFADIWAETEATKEEIVIEWRLWHCHSVGPCELASFGKTPELNHQESSRWYFAGAFTLERCPPTGFMSAYAAEHDPLFDDFLGFDFADLIFDCSGWEDAFSAGDYGLVGHRVHHVSGLDPQYSYDIEFKVILDLN